VSEPQPSFNPQPKAAAAPSLGGVCLVQFGLPATSVPVPIIGIGETGQLLNDPEFLNQAPPAYYWVWGHGPPIPAGNGRADPGPLTPLGAVTAEEHEQALASFVEQFHSHLHMPITIIIGELDEARSTAQTAWLETVARETGTQLIWIPPFGDSATLEQEPPVNAMVYLGEPGWRQPELLPTTAPLDNGPAYYARLLTATLRSLGHPTLLCAELCDLQLVFVGSVARLFRGEGNGSGRATQAMRSAIQQLQACHWERETIQGVFIQLAGELDMEPTEGDEAIEAWRAFVGDGWNGTLCIGMPVHDHGGAAQGRILADLIVCRA